MSSPNYFLAEQRTNVNHLNYYYFTNAFTPEEIVKIIEIGESQVKQSGTTVSNELESTVNDYRVSEISWINDNPETKWIYDKLAHNAKLANKEMWNFDLWDYYDSLQYTKYYGNGGHYDWHADLGAGISNRKLSCVLQLSTPEEYEGGDLEMNPGGGIVSVPKGLGTLCFFPSFLLHRVTPLTSGVRKSLVTWISGANFR